MSSKITIATICFSLFLFVSDCGAQNTKYKELEASIDSISRSGEIIGFSACILKENEIVWTKTFGMADVENDIPVNINTLFVLASLSKTVTGAALMHLFDKGAFALDEDINKYLPFKIRNPNFPDIPITFRMLLTHTSSLTDVNSYISKLYGPGDQRTVSLGDIIKNCYTVNGTQYNTRNFLNNKPGETWEYCNSGYVLIAYLVELLSKKPFPEYTKENLFKPLEMDAAGWRFSDFDTTRIAVNYEWNPENNNKMERVYHYSWSGYSDGCLITSVPQFANFIKMLSNKGVYKGKQVLKSETVSMILNPQHVKNTPVRITPPILDMGLTWMVTKDGRQNYFMHGGGGSGIMTQAYFNPTTKSGVIIFLTGQWEVDHATKRYDTILFKLFTRYLNN